MEQIVTLTTALKFAHLQNNRKSRGFYASNVNPHSFLQDVENDLLFLASKLIFNVCWHEVKEIILKCSGEQN